MTICVIPHKSPEGTTERVSIGLDGDDANAMSYFPSLSFDGRWVAFASMASNLVAGDTNDVADVFVYDRVTNRTERMSVSSAGEQSEEGGFEVLGPSISADGRHVSFVSHASNLVPGDTNNVEDVFVHDRQTGRTRRVSVDSIGAESDGPSGFHAISGDGSVVTFVSAASNLVGDDTNGETDVFAHDLDAGTTIRVSRGLGGTEANGTSEMPSISGDGRTVAFTSAASNLVPDDTNGFPDTFAVDLQTQEMERVSVDSDGIEADGPSLGINSDFSFGPRLSGDGRLVVFVAEAWREDVSQDVGVFLHDRGSGATERVSTFADPEFPSQLAGFPAINHDGQQVAFLTGVEGSDFVDRPEIFVRYRGLETTELVSVNATGTEGQGHGFIPAIAEGGRIVAFMSEAPNLVPGDENGELDVFVRDRDTGTTELISARPDGQPGRGYSGLPTITPDGRFVAFTSNARDLLDPEQELPSNHQQVYVRNRETGVTEIVSAGAEPGDRPSWAPALSADGRYVAFYSNARNLVEGDTNEDIDVFVADRLTHRIERVSVSSQGIETPLNTTHSGWTSSSWIPSISADGNIVTFASEASTLVPDDTNDRVDVFAHDRRTHQTERVSVSSAGDQGDDPSLAQLPVYFEYAQSGVSNDGRYVAFASLATNLVEGDTNLMPDVFLRDRVTNTTERLSVTHDSGESSGMSFLPTISADGQRVGFTSSADNLVEGDTNNTYDVFLFDRSIKKTWRVSVNSDLEQGNGMSAFGAISPDGHSVAFASLADNLVARDTNGNADVFVHDFIGGGDEFIDRPPEELFGIRESGGYASDPVNTATGNFTTGEMDLSFPTSGLDLTRSYNAGNKADGPFGRGWSPSFAAHVHENAGGTLTFVDADGRIVSFTPKPPTSGGPNPIGTDGYERPEEMFADLVKTTDGTFELRYFSGETWVFNADGRLTATQSWDDTSVTFAYDPNGKLVSIADSTGPTLSFTYTGNHITRAEASDGRVVSYGYDATGNLVSVANPVGGVTTYSHNADGLITKITDPDGHVVLENSYDSRDRVASQRMGSGATATFAYDDATGRTTVTDATTGVVVTYLHDTEGRLIGIIDPYGLSLAKTYDEDGNLIGVVDRLGAGSNQTFDAHGNLLSTTRPGGVTETFTYDTLDRILASTDAAGNTTSYGYDGNERVPSQITDANGAVSLVDVRNGLIVSQTDPDGVTITFAYDSARRLVSSADEAGNVTHYGYDDEGNVVSLTSPLGHVTSTTYSADGQVLSETDPTGAVTRYEYAANGALLKTIDPTGATTSMAYDAAGRLASETDANGAVTTYIYDDHNNLIELRSPGGAVTKSTFDAMGRLLTSTDAMGGVTKFAYNGDGRQTSVTHPTGAVTSRTLDVRGREIESIDALGRVTRTEYDILDRAIKRTDPSGAVSQTIYDSVGNVVESIDPIGARTQARFTPAGRLAIAIDPLGNTTTYGYDNLGQLITVDDPLGNKVTTTYDADGNVTSAISPSGLIARFRYDAAGRQIEQRDPRGGVSKTIYSARDEVLEEQDPTGAKKRYAYDPAGNMIKAIDPNNGVTSFVYDQQGNRVSMTDQQGAVTKYEYDLAGRLVTETDPLGRASRFTYDARGLLTKILDPSGRSETSTFDASGQLLSRVFGDNSSVSYTYDQSGQRTSMTDATGVTRYRYDARGSLTTVTQPDGKAVISRFDASGNRVGLTYPDGSIATFSYDKANQLTGLSHPQAGAVSYSLDAESRLIKEALPDGSTRSYGYTKDLMTSFTQTEKGKKQTSTTFEHDGVGRVTNETSNKKTTNYTYDPAGQLIKETRPDSKPASYSYDKVGNRTAVSVQGKTTNFTFDAAGQLQQAKQGSKLTQYTYDQAGRLLSENGPETSVTRAYGANGLLAARVVNSDDDDDDDDDGGSGKDSWAYTYNGDGTLTKLISPNANDDDNSPRTTQNDFIWDTTGVAEILTWSAKGINTNLFYGYGRALAQQSSKTTVFAQDAYGSTIAKDGNDSFAIARSFDSWGNPNPSSDDEDGIKLGFGYRGELHLGDDIHLRARTYAPQTGRFTTQDPLNGVDGEVMVANPYPYAANDPLNLVDPLGLSPVSDDDLQVMGASVTASGASSSGGGSASPQVGSVRIPPRPGYGKLRINLFISACESGYGSQLYRGDCRTFNQAAGNEDSRVTFTIDFETGRVSVFVNDSCRVGGGCHDAKRLGVNPPGISDACRRARVPSTSCEKARAKANPPNLVRVSNTAANVMIGFKLINSATPWLLPTPAINGTLRITPIAKSNRLKVCFDGDDYPSLEAYQQVGEKTRRLLRVSESGFGPGSLFPPAPNRQVCSS
ncbi:MAG: DUF6531 domain-containing protein [Acidimicrobiales bacterium]